MRMTDRLEKLEDSFCFGRSKNSSPLFIPEA